MIPIGLFLIHEIDQEPFSDWFLFILFSLLGVMLEVDAARHTTTIENWLLKRHDPQQTISSKK